LKDREAKGTGLIHRLNGQGLILKKKLSFWLEQLDELWCHSLDREHWRTKTLGKR
jgi:hypothetical protein